MADENEENGSWTAFPSLLPSLSTSQQEALEDAACAHYCGRYHDADVIFESRLPPSHTIPILALQHADMLSSSGREHQRIEVLENTLMTLSFEDEAEYSCLEMLLKMMLAEAKFFAFGHAPQEENARLLRSLRVQLRGRSLESLSDLEIRCITAYHEFVCTLETHTNFIGRSDQTIFEDRYRNKLFESKIDELRELLRILQAQQRWRFAPTLMQLVLKHTRKIAAPRATTTEAISLCSIIDGETHPGVKYGSIIVRRIAADILDETMPSLAVTLRQEIIETLEQLSDLSYSQWQDFCPIISSYMQKIEACSKEISEEQKLSMLRSLAEAAEERNDYQDANQLYLAWHDEAKAQLDELKDDDNSRPVALERLRRIQESLMYFHRGRTRCVYLWGAMLVNYLSNLYINYPVSSEMVHLINEFLYSYPDFSVPLLLERIYGLGVNATSNLGQDDKRGHFQSKHLEWTSNCPFWEAGSHGLTEQAILDPTQTLRKIHGERRDLITWGTNALQLLHLWVAHEWETGLLTTEEVKALFGPGLGNLPRGNVGEYLRELEINRFERCIFGTADEIKDHSAFLNQYRRLQDWALLEDRLPNQSSRLYAMSILLQSRIARITRYRGEDPDAIGRQQADINEVREQLSQLNALQTHQDDAAAQDYETKVISGAIRLTLFRSCLPNTVARGLISDNELQLRIIDCQRLVERYRNRGHTILEYRASTQLIRLIWQRHVHFQAPSETLLPVAEEANRAFTKIRKLILTKDASEDLVAEANLSKEFKHRDHFSYALLGSLTALDTYLAQYLTLQRTSLPVPQDLEERVWQNYDSFLSWSLRAKQSGFVDLLNLKSGIDEYVNVNGDIYRPFQSRPIDEPRWRTLIVESVDDSHQNARSLSSEGTRVEGKIATPHQMDDILQSLPDNVVILDFVNLKYPQSTATRIVAVIYKKGQMATILKIPKLEMSDIDKWVKEYIDEPQKRGLDPLSGSESGKSLEELGNLIRELTGPAEHLPSGHTLIICPTGSLNRVPVHAIPIGEGDSKKKLIERNPIVYCQSLTVLHWLWQRFANKPRPDDALKVKARVIHPMSDPWETKKQFMSPLWPIKDEDGAEFSSAFYAVLARQQEMKRKHCKLAEPPTTKGFSYFKLLSSCFGEVDEPAPDLRTAEIEDAKFLGDSMDMALAMQEAVVGLLHDPDRKEVIAPYHWATFAVNVFWLLPSRVIPKIDSSDH
ncbi:hypothetical protein PT974_03588 [Cladobotryum mycophilum]|uniref:Uncharacterized protein n=1 Tax=Cladobotryum mycophilum TaxID=491253 RepID=A0ABR0STU8_9HYPO